jgi:hypothetical protein
VSSLRRFIVVCCAGIAAPGAAAPPESQRNFVSCPIVRDTQSVPCWLAEYEGELYFLTLQTDVSAPVNPPWLGHRVLVEGTVAADRPRICGGVVLEPVTLSVLPQLDPSCNTMLPAEERYNLTFEPPRPPGPSGGQLAFAAPPPAPAPPASGPKDFELRYDFDGMVVFRHARDLEAILRHARESGARRVVITGHRGAALLSNGETLTESAGIERRRAEQVAELLRGAGLDALEYDVRWEELPSPPDGVSDALRRRVAVSVVP